jgi:hypothetical protein
MPTIQMLAGLDLSTLGGRNPSYGNARQRQAAMSLRGLGVVVPVPAVLNPWYTISKGFRGGEVQRVRNALLTYAAKLPYAKASVMGILGSEPSNFYGPNLVTALGQVASWARDLGDRTLVNAIFNTNPAKGSWNLVTESVTIDGGVWEALNRSPAIRTAASKLHGLGGLGGLGSLGDANMVQLLSGMDERYMAAQPKAPCGCTAGLGAGPMGPYNKRLCPRGTIPNYNNTACVKPPNIHGLGGIGPDGQWRDDAGNIIPAPTVPDEPVYKKAWFWGVIAVGVILVTGGER